MPFRQRPRHTHQARGAARPQRSSIQIAQGNVQRAADPHSILLQLCYQNHIDIILVQEPHVHTSNQGHFISHPGYHAYVPVDSWTAEVRTRPRVITYIHKDSNLQVQQRRPWQTRDLLWLEVCGYSILNVYKPPQEPTSETTQHLFNITPPANFLVAGDFNAHHRDWDPDTTQTRNDGEQLHNWAATHSLALISEIGTPTHNQGGTIDLAFSNIPFATAELADQLHPGADHAALLTTLPGRRRIAIDHTRPSIAEDKLETFQNLVSLAARQLQPLEDPPSTIQLDNLASKIIDTIQHAIKATESPPRSHGRNAAWWTEDCRRAHRTWKQAKHAHPLNWMRLPKEGIP
jgi:hypothetical protein